MSLNLLQVLPPTFIQESLSTRTIYENLDVLYELDNEVRLALLDLIRLRKLSLTYGIVYSFGNNEFGQLGIGNTSNKEIPTAVDFSTITDSKGKKKRVIQVAAGYNYSLILCADGTVYSVGYNISGQLGTGSTDNEVIPTQINPSTMEERKVIQVSAGGFHSLILCDDGSVFSFGESRSGQGGTGHTDNITIPTKINTTNIGNKRVIQVSAGAGHSLILCEDGTVYAFGNNGWGQMGTGDTNNVAIPTAIDTLNLGERKVIQVSAGDQHSLILCEDGTVYSFGNGYYGRLGTGTTDITVTPTQINTENIGEKRVIQVSAGSYHSLILCGDGTMYLFGQDKDGRMGDNVNGVKLIPTLFDTSLMTDVNGKRKKIIQVSARTRYSLILCEDGTVYVFYNGKHAQLGGGYRNIQREPLLLVDTSLIGRVIQVAAGGNHSLLLI